MGSNYVLSILRSLSPLPRPDAGIWLAACPLEPGVAGGADAPAAGGGGGTIGGALEGGGGGAIAAPPGGGGGGGGGAILPPGGGGGGGGAPRGTYGTYIDTSCPMFAIFNKIIK